MQVGGGNLHWQGAGGVHEHSAGGVPLGDREVLNVVTGGILGKDVHRKSTCTIHGQGGGRLLLMGFMYRVLDRFGVGK